MTDSTYKPGTKAKIAGGLGAGAAIAAAMALAIPDIKVSEGKRNVTYLDVVSVPTACYGSTGPHVGRIGTRWTDGQCDALLMADVRKHLDGVLKCTPGIINNAPVLAAATELTFNIGVGAYCRSTVARRFNAGRLREGCDAFRMWVKAGGRTWPGLVKRRDRERVKCLQGVV